MTDHSLIPPPAPITPVTSEMHLACFRADAKRAETRSQLDEIGRFRAARMLPRDREAAREIWKAAARRFGVGHDIPNHAPGDGHV